MRTATEDLLTLHHGLSRWEDRLLPSRWWDESSLVGKAGGVAWRFGKFALIDVPVDYFTVVFAHEVAGHGARYREFGIAGIHYAFSLPPPYGKGGGEASNRRSINLSVDEGIAIWAGGVESHPLLQRGLAMRWVETGRIHYREAFLYFWSFQIAYRYIQDARPDLLDGTTDDDPRAIARLLAAGWGTLTPSMPVRLTVDDLKTAAHVNLADPLLFTSMYVGVVSYLWSGKEGGELPMLRLGSLKFLPMLRSNWTPFGVEYHLETFARTGSRTARLDLRTGGTAIHSGWGGVNLEVRRIVDEASFRLDGQLMAWRQPALRSGWSPSTEIANGLGGGFTLRVMQGLDALRTSLRLVGEVGYKTGGFLEGYPLAATPLVLIGIAWEP